MATVKSQYLYWNGITWDKYYFESSIDMVIGLQTVLDNKIDKRTGILKSGGVVDTTGLFPYAITTAATAIGFEYNVLLNASKKGYTFTQSGTGQISVPAGLCDGMLSPQYSGDGVNPADPFVLLIEGLPNTHTQTGGIFGWTSRYWNPTKYKVEAYDQYAGGVWKTLVDEQSGVTTKDLVIPIYPSFSGSLTKFRITIYDSNGSIGTNGHRRWGLSEIFFIHPEAQSTHQFLDVEWAKKLSTARQINGINFDGSNNITVPSTDVKTWAKDGLVESASGNLNDLIQTGFYQGSSLTNAPTTGWYFYIVSRYRADSNWLSQIAISFGSGNTGNRTYTRSKIGGVWSSWVELYSTGQKPSPDDIGAMPKIGGAFTGPVSFNDNITSDGGYILFTGLDSINFDGAVLANVSDPYYAQDAATKNYVDSLGLGDLFNVAISSPGTDHAIVWNGTSWANTAINKTFIGLSSVENYGIATQAEAEAGTSGLKYMTPQRTEQAIRKRSIAQVITRTVSATLALTDENDFVYVNSSSALTFTIPPNSSVAFPVGTEIHFMRYGTGEVSLAPGSGVTLLSDGTKRRINTQYQVVTIKKILTDTWVLFGAIKT